MSGIKDQMNSFLDFVRGIIRAVNGQSASDSRYPYLIDEEDLRERTRGDGFELEARTYERMLDKYGTHLDGFREYKIMSDFADMEDKYAISLDGLQRAEAIQMQKAKTQTPLEGVTIQPVTNVEQQQKAEEKEHKKGLFHRK